MPTIEELEAEIVRREGGTEMQQQMPPELQEQMAQQAEANAYNPVQAEEEDPGIDMDQIMSAQYAKAPTAGKQVLNEFMGVKLDKEFPTLSYAKQWNDEYETQQASGEVLAKLDTIQKQIDRLNKATKGNAYLNPDPDNPYIGKIANPIKDAIGRITGNKEEMLAREDLESTLHQFQIEVEKGLKGGVLGEKMYQRLGKLGALPELNQGLDVVQTKLQTMQQHAKEMQDAASLSLKTGRAIPTNKLHMFEEAAAKEEAMPQMQQAKNIEDAISNYDKQFPQFKDVPRETKIQFLKSKGLINEQE